MLPLLENVFKDILLRLVQEKYEISLDASKIRIDTPPNPDMGDIASPIGFLLTKTLKRNPFEIVSELAEAVTAYPEIEKAEPAKPGFLNLTLSNDFLEKRARAILNDANALAFESQNKKIVLEYVSANPTGPLHIGHGRWAALGDSIARLFKAVGYEVHREFYVNDAGVQIGNLKRTVEALKKGEEVPEDGYQGEFVKEALKSDLEPDEYFLQRQKNTLESFKVKFDTFYSERTLHSSGVIPKAIELLREKGYIYDKDDAVWFRSTDFGDDKDRVLIKSDGSYTYFAPDIAYHLTKIERGGDWLIDILGADHHGYVKRITSGVMALSEKKVRFDVLIGQLVNLFRGGEPVRMSKRTGDIITLEEVMEEIGSDALRYILVSKKQTQTVDFDLDEVKQKTKDNPVFYIQYAFARINSIMKKLPEAVNLENVHLNELNQSERKLLMKVMQFKDEIFYTAQDMEPHRLAAFLLDFAGLFHSFYEKNRVIDNDEVIAYRVFLIQVAAQVLRAGLSLLGIESPESM